MMKTLKKHTALLALCMLAACSTTRHAGDQWESGFLDDYSRMEPSPSGEGSFWANTQFDLGDFDRIHVPAVELWMSGSNEGGLASDDSKRLAGLFGAKMVEELRDEGWQIADESGPRVLVVRVALTELDAANQAGNIVTSVPFMSTAAIQLLAISADVHVFVGEVSTEVQILDGGTGDVLAEALDRRVGSHSLINIGSTWGDVEDAMGTWAERLAKNLKEQ